MDPLGDRVAAVRHNYDVWTSCQPGGPRVRQATIVVLDAAAGTSHDLFTLTTSDFLRGGFYTGYIGLVAVDGSDGNTPRIAVPDDETHLPGWPFWHNAHSLWFLRGSADAAHGPARPLPKSESAAVDVHVQVLGVLVAPEVGEHGCLAVAVLDRPGEVLDDGEESRHVRAVLGGDSRQRPDVLLRHDDDVVLPVRPRVMEGEHPLVVVLDP